MTTAYPYDPAGTNSACMIVDEIHNIANYTNVWRCIIPLAAPFTRDDLSLTLDGRELYEGLDYYLGHYYPDGAAATLKPTYGSIMLIDQSIAVGSLAFKYRTLGGNTTVTRKRALEYLAQVDLPDPRNALWDSVLSIPVVIAATDAPTNLTAALAVDPVLRALQSIANNIESSNAAIADSYNTVFERLTNLTQRINSLEIRQHPTGAHKHSVTYEQIGALRHDATAVNALRAYGYSVAELVSYIASLGTTPASLDKYAKLAGSMLKGGLNFVMSADSNNAYLQNAAGTAYINFVDGNIYLVGESVDINADGVVAASGVNTISLCNNYKQAVYNGQFLIHAGNLRDFMKNKIPSGAARLTLYSLDTARVNFSGTGTSADPLYGVVKFVNATESTAGLLLLTSSTTGSADVAASAASIYAAMQQTNNYVNGTVTINGYALNTTPVLTAADFELGNVSNTSPMQKPASHAFIAALSALANKIHAHTPATITDLGYASSVNEGVVKLAPTTPDFTVVDKAATPEYLEAVLAQSDALDAAIGDILTYDELPLQRAVFNPSAEATIPFTFSGLTLTINAGVGINYRGVDYTTTGSTATITGAGVWYLHALKMSTGVYFYISPDYCTTSPLVATIVADATQIISATMSSMDTLYRNAELFIHATARDHDLTHGLKTHVGLDPVRNYGAVTAVPTAWAPGTVDWSVDTETPPRLTYVGATESICIAGTAGDFRLVASLASTAEQTGAIGLVLAYADGVPLTVERITGADYGIRYRLGNVVIRAAIAGDSRNWAEVGSARLDVTRIADIYTINAYEYSSGVVVDSFTFKLSDFPELAAYKQSTQYGFIANIPAIITLNRLPVSDPSQHYATTSALLSADADRAKKAILAVGSVTDGGTIPLPELTAGDSFTAAQCKAILVPQLPPAPTTSDKLTGISLSVDATLKATVQYSYGSTVVAGTATYYLVGLR